MKTAACAVLLLLCSSPSVLAQQPQKTQLVFHCQCSDAVGTLFGSAFRDLLATSPRYVEASEAEVKGADGKVTSYHWQLKVLSMDDDDSSPGNATVISAVLLAGDTLYFDHYVQTCGKNKVAFCAQQLLANVDGDITSLKQK